MNRLRVYLELAKPRILVMVLVTTTFGFLLGGGTRGSVGRLFFTLLGMGAATGGAAALNNYLERDYDAKMVRTRRRALPAGLIEPFRALLLGVSLTLFGVLLLVGAANLLAGFLALLAAFLYVLIGMAGWVYFFGAMLLGILMLVAALNFARERNDGTARGLLTASVVCLPLLLGSIIVDAGFNWFR